MIRVADYIARFLVSRGVEDIFMLTGNGAMYLNDALAHSAIRYYCARNEAAAPMMAEAYARIRQSMGVVCLTSGPGSTNAIPGLAEAYVDSAPVMIVSGQVQRGHTTHNLSLSGVRTFGTAEIDIVPIVRPLTKYAVMVNDPLSIRYHLERAAHLATTGRPGPVWLDIPMDVQFEMIDPDTLEGFEPGEADSTQPTPSDIRQVADLIRRSKRPVLIAGHGVRLAQATGELRALMEGANLPAIFSRFGQDLLPFSHPNNFGQAGLKGSKYCATLMKAADVVVALGCRLAVQLVGHKFDAFAQEATVVVVDIEADELRKPGLKIDVAVRADVKPFMASLAVALGSSELPDWQPWLGYCRELKASYPIVDPELARNPIDLYYFMSRLDAAAGASSIFVTDAGSNYYVGGQVYRFEHGQREITSGTFAAMGLSIPLAIGASIADRDAQVLAVTGDGSLELNIQELKTMSHYDLNIKLFVINNGGYVSMRNWQDHLFEGRRIDTAENTGAGTLNLEKVADAFELRYVRIESYDRIDSYLQQVLSDPQPTFVEVVCDDKQKIVEPINDLSFRAVPDTRRLLS